MHDVLIAGYVRTPFHFASKGAMARTRPDTMLATALQALVARSGVDPASIEDVIVGCAFPEAEQGLNVARLATFLAGLPITPGGVTVNRFCGSSMQAIHQAAGAIRMGAGEAFLCAGVESMSRVPMGGFNPMPHPQLAADYPAAYVSMGITAENLARQYNISRASQESFANESQTRAAAAAAAGQFAAELVAVEDITTDGCIRGSTPPEKLAELRPAFLEGGSVTAATASPLTDGAAAVLVVSAAYAKQHGLKPLAVIRAIAVAGCAPEIMGIGPVAASQKALARAGLKLADIDLAELNEAFAAQALAVLHDLPLDRAKVNIDGGAIALGHPLGASGARITGKAASLLQRTGARHALATMCIGGGQGIATVLERA